MGAPRLLVNKTRNEIFYYGYPQRYDINSIKDVISLGWEKDDEIYFMNFSWGNEENIEFEIDKYNDKFVLLVTDTIKDFDIEKLKEKYPLDKNNKLSEYELTVDHLVHFRNYKFIMFKKNWGISNLEGYIIWSKVDE